MAVPDSDFYTCKPGDGDYNQYTSTYFQEIVGSSDFILNCYYRNPTTSYTIYCTYDVNGKFRPSGSSDSGCPDNGADLTPAAPYDQTCYTVW